jgi:hypothetical protein
MGAVLSALDCKGLVYCPESGADSDVGSDGHAQRENESEA